MGNYYAGSMSDYGIFDTTFGIRTKCYYGMKAFNLMTKYEHRVSVRKPENEKDIGVLAGRKDNGQAAILVSCFKSPAREIKLDIANFKIVPGSAKSTFSTTNTTFSRWTPCKSPALKSRFRSLSCSAVFLVELL